jgi:tetratricopeptide (TPR) repeat protein
MIEAGMKASIPLLLIAGALQAANTHGSEPPDDWFRQVETANRLVEAGDLDRAAAVYTAALERARAAGDGLGAGVVLQNLGRLLGRQGRFREAEVPTCEESVNSKLPAQPMRLLVRATAGLSAVYLQTEQYSKAETLITGVLNSHPAGADSDEAALMSNLGVILAHKQQFGEAERLLRWTAEVCAGVPDPEMQEVGAVAVANRADCRWWPDTLTLRSHRTGKPSR